MISAMLCVGMGFLLDEENTGCAGHAMSSSLATAPSLCDAGAWDGGVLKMGAMRATLATAATAKETFLDVYTTEVQLCHRWGIRK